MQIKSFRDLRVWQAGIELVKTVYELTSKFPRSETYGLASLQHLSIAQASLAELETQVEIARQLNYISESDSTDLLTKISSLGRQLFALRNALINPKARTASPGS